MSCRKMRKRNFKRSLRVQRLEDRRLLAADLAVFEVAPVEAVDTVMCLVAEPEVESGGLEFGGEELPVAPVDADVTELQPEVDVDSEVLPEAEVEVETATEAEGEVDTDVELDTENETLVHDLGDPVDGTDGFFGSIDADSLNQSFAISPSEVGLVDVVVSSSLGDGEIGLEVTDSSGEVVDSAMTEDVAGFQVLTFEAEAGETYQLNVSAQEGAEGYFQVTASYNADLHADTVGEDSTELEFVDGATALGGELEVDGDVDTFRFTADSGGKVLLGLAELNADNATELQVQVLDSAGEAITRGITNETVGISFDVESGGEYFLAISAGEGQTGSYHVELTLEADAVEPEPAPEVEPEPTVEPEVLPEPTVEPEAEAEPTVEPEVEPEPTAEPEAEVEPTVEPEAELEPEVEVEPAIEPEVEVEPTVEPELVPEPTVAPEAELEPTVEPEVEPEPTVEPEVEVDLEPVADLHANEVGDDATELTFVDDVASVAGELETGEDSDAFQFIAPGNGEISLDLTAASESNAADASVAVFGSTTNDDAVVTGTTNDDVGILFDVVEGDSYQVLVDAVNDVPASYELSLTFTEADFSGDVSPVDQMEPVEDLPEVDLVDDSPGLTGVVDVADGDSASDDLEVCFTGHEGENEIVDAIFAHFNPDALFSFAGQFGIRQG